MSQNPIAKSQSPYQQQATVRPIMVGVLPSAQPVSRTFPHGHYFNEQQPHQEINFLENAKIREETLTTDNPQTIKYALYLEDKDEEYDNRPFDPNLVCLTCKKQFQIGEIQEYKKHCETCRIRYCQAEEDPFQLDSARQSFVSPDM